MSTAIHTTLFVRFLYDMHHRTVHMSENTKEATGFSSDERRTQQCRTRSCSVSAYTTKIVLLVHDLCIEGANHWASRVGLAILP
jgi:hypothetical protein